MGLTTSRARQKLATNPLYRDGTNVARGSTLVKPVSSHGDATDEIAKFLSTHKNGLSHTARPSIVGTVPSSRRRDSAALFPASKRRVSTAHREQVSDGDEDDAGNTGETASTNDDETPSSYAPEEDNVRRELIDMLAVYYVDHDFDKFMLGKLRLDRLADWTFINGLPQLNKRFVDTYGEDLRAFAQRTQLNNVQMVVISGMWRLSDQYLLSVRVNAPDVSSSPSSCTSPSSTQRTTKLGSANIDHLVKKRNRKRKQRVNRDSHVGATSEDAARAWSLDSLRIELESYFAENDPMGLKEDLFRVLMAYGMNVGRRELERKLCFKYNNYLNNGNGPLIHAAEEVVQHKHKIMLLITGFYQKYDRDALEAKEIDLDGVAEWTLDTGVARLNSRLEKQYGVDLTTFLTSLREEYVSAAVKNLSHTPPTRRNRETKRRQRLGNERPKKTFSGIRYLSMAMGRKRAKRPEDYTRFLDDKERERAAAAGQIFWEALENRVGDYKAYMRPQSTGDEHTSLGQAAVGAFLDAIQVDTKTRDDPERAEDTVRRHSSSSCTEPSNQLVRGTAMNSTEEGSATANGPQTAPSSNTKSRSLFKLWGASSKNPKSRGGASSNDTPRGDSSTNKHGDSSTDTRGASSNDPKNHGAPPHHQLAPPDSKHSGGSNHPQKEPLPVPTSGKSNNVKANRFLVFNSSKTAKKNRTSTGPAGKSPSRRPQKLSVRLLKPWQSAKQKKQTRNKDPKSNVMQQVNKWEKARKQLGGDKGTESSATPADVVPTAQVSQLTLKFETKR